MDHVKARELREKRAALADQASKVLDRENRTAEDNEKFDAMMADIDALKVEIDRVERMEALEAETRGVRNPPNGAVDGQQDAVTCIEEYRAAEKRHGASALKEVRPEVRNAVQRCHEEYWEANKAYLIGGDANLSSEARSILRGERPEFRALGCRSVIEGRSRESRAMGTGGGNALQGTGGGYFVPVGFVDEVEEALKYYGDMMNVSDKMVTATGQPLPYPTDNDTANAGVLLAENAQVSEQDLTLGSITFGAYKFSTQMIQVSIELMQDSAFDLETFIKKKFSIRLGRVLNTYFTTGTGTNQPQGILTAANAGPVATGSANNDGGAETGGTSIGSDDLINLEYAVDPLYRRGAIYIAHDTTIKKLKQLKDKYGRPLWLPGLAVKAPDTINGYEYSVNNDMPTIAVNAKTVLFGQVKKYTIRQVKELGVLRLDQRYADYGQVAFIGFARYDGKLLDAGTHPVAYLSQAAS